MYKGYAVSGPICTVEPWPPFRIRIRRDLHKIGLLDPNPDPHSKCGSGSEPHEISGWIRMKLVRIRNTASDIPPKYLKTTWETSPGAWSPCRDWCRSFGTPPRRRANQTVLSDGRSWPVEGPLPSACSWTSYNQRIIDASWRELLNWPDRSQVYGKLVHSLYSSACSSLFFFFKQFCGSSHFLRIRSPLFTRILMYKSSKAKLYPISTLH